MNGCPPNQLPADEPDVLRREVDRRRFLAWLGGAGAIGLAGCSGRGQPGSGATAPAPDRRGGPRPSVQRSTENDPLSAPARTAEAETVLRSDRNRRLVVVELSGGNDGLSMLQPLESGGVQDLRPGLATPDEELLDAGHGFGWHPSLAGLHDRGLAAVVGVGSHEPDFSHFEMEQRWWNGVSSDGGREGSGFFGRLCDELDVGDPVTGLSFSGGPSPALAARKAVTVGLADPGVGWFFLQDDPWFAELRRAYGSMAIPSADDDEHFVAARGGLTDTLRFADALNEIPEDDDDLYPWTNIGRQLRYAAAVLALDVGVRVIHVQHGGFDTHTGQGWRHRQLMTELDEASVAFVNDLEIRGLIEDTLVMTTSEFGRRVRENDGGSDHGGASTMAVFGGGARAGVHGEAPDLRVLDDGNLVATARFEDYYATIAEQWFGIDAVDVLPTGGTPITGLLA